MYLKNTFLKGDLLVFKPFVSQKGRVTVAFFFVLGSTQSALTVPIYRKYVGVNYTFHTSYSSSAGKRLIHPQKLQKKLLLKIFGKKKDPDFKYEKLINLVLSK